MQITGITPNLMVSDMRKSLDFYAEYFDFELVAAMPPEGDDKVFAIIRSGQTELMLQTEKSLHEDCPLMERFKPGDGAFTLYIDVEDIKALYERVKGRLELLKDLHTTFYGATEFVLRDPDGYVLWVGEQGE